MKTYLILRQKEDATETAKTLEAKGSKVIIEPIFSVEKLKVNINDTKPQALIITSANACDAITNSTIAKDIAIFAVGSQTAQKLLKNGYNNISYAPENSAKSLKKLIEKNLNPKQGNILYFCGDSITLDFKQELEPLGFKVTKIIAYKIHWKENFSTEFLEIIRTEPIDFILFYSQNSVKKFHELAKNNNLLEYFDNSQLLCLSNKIATTAKNLGFKNLGDFIF